MLYTGTVYEHYVQMLDRFDHTVLYWNELNLLVVVERNRKIAYITSLQYSKLGPFKLMHCTKVHACLKTMIRLISKLP